MGETEQRQMMELLKVLLCRLGGRVEITKKEYTEAKGRLEIVPFHEPEETRIILQLWPRPMTIAEGSHAKPLGSSRIHR